MFDSAHVEVVARSIVLSNAVNGLLCAEHQHPRTVQHSKPNSRHYPESRAQEASARLLPKGRTVNAAGNFKISSSKLTWRYGTRITELNSWYTSLSSTTSSSSHVGKPVGAGSDGWTIRAPDMPSVYCASSTDRLVIVDEKWRFRLTV